jgi:hypothetical protein
MNSINKSKEREYCYDILEAQLKIFSDSIDPNEVQKKKFQILLKLVFDLFKYKNSKKCFKTISNLIITTLLSFEENTPLDSYSEGGNELENLENDIKKESKQILLKELFKMNNQLPN